MIRYVDSLNPAAQRVFLRVDFNVPYDSAGRILDDSRIQEALPTIRYLLEKRARLILASHLGRPKGRDPALSLLAIGEYLTAALGREVIFPESSVGDAVRKLVHELKEGEVILLENLRFHPEEEANDPLFSQKLASLADIYVTDAFGTLHRAHASTAGMVIHFKEKSAGFLIRKELETLGKLLSNPKRPFYAILGGAKVSDKIGVIENLLSRVDGLLLGGALSYTFLAALGHDVGQSKVEKDKIYLAQKVLRRATERGVKIHLPVDHRVVFQLDREKPSPVEVVSQIRNDAMGVDIGPEAVAAYRKILQNAETIFWNGPMGIFEIPPYAEGTFEIARAIAKPGITSVVGGGESVTACKQAGVAPQITHLSTGGGATLEYLEGKELPGLKALEAT
ncbi:MAG: phosphoglycerate kinase [Deltaproteobacteria bacterium]|nr:phosphoglycerate kinase [Deltaproteobacteria bacterium]